MPFEDVIVLFLINKVYLDILQGKIQKVMEEEIITKSG